MDISRKQKGLGLSQQLHQRNQERPYHQQFQVQKHHKHQEEKLQQQVQEEPAPPAPSAGTPPVGETPAGSNFFLHCHFI